MKSWSARPPRSLGFASTDFFALKVGNHSSTAASLLPKVERHTVFLHSMRVRVMLRREGGAHRAPVGQGHTATGDLHLTHRIVRNRSITLLELLGADHALWPNLYEPKLVTLDAKQMTFLGFERHEDRAWVLQQWDCELL